MFIWISNEDSQHVHSVEPEKYNVLQINFI